MNRGLAIAMQAASVVLAAVAGGNFSQLATMPDATTLGYAGYSGLPALLSVASSVGAGMFQSGQQYADAIRTTQAEFVRLLTEAGCLRSIMEVEDEETGVHRLTIETSGDKP